MPYLELSGLATNPNQEIASSREPVKDQADALLKMEITYTNLFPGLTMTATYHACGHGPKNDTCIPIVLKVFTGPSKPDMTKFIKLESIETNKYALTTKYVLSITGKADADAQEAAIKSAYPSKTFETTKSPEAAK